MCVALRESGTLFEIECKLCRKCGVAKPRSEFNRRRSTHDGLQSYCRSCARATRNRLNRSNYRSESHPPSVYAVEAAGDLGSYVKVGRTVNMKNRLQMLQTGSPLDHTLVTLYECSSEPEAREVERLAQDQLSDFLARGEWYMVSPELAARAILEAAKKVRENATQT